MLETVFLDRALCLPAIDIAALLQGQLIAIIPSAPVQRDWAFALYPYIESSSVLSIHQQYHQRILPLAQSTVAQQQSSTIAIEAWAKCVGYKMLYEVEQLEALSRLTIWTQDLLKKALQQRQPLLLAFLQVYRMPELIKLPLTQITPEKFGKFVGLPILDEALQKPIKITQLLPVLSDPDFARRKQQLEELRPPLHPELEDLQSAIAHLSATFPAAKALEADIGAFLGCTSEHPQKSTIDSDLSWIRTISPLGLRSKELDRDKSNYQAGTDFENIVHKSLGFLGFTVDTAYKGGAGGLDLYCSKPYPLVGECKSGKKIPSGTTEELIKLGGMHLDSEKFLAEVKLIIGPGNPTPDVLTAAQKWRVSIIKPMSLQKLAELKFKHPGAVNLLELKKYLEPGQIDHKIDQYIEKVEKDLKLRLNILESVKLLAKPNMEQLGVLEIRTCYNLKFAEVSDRDLDNETVYELLLELASPLAGHLGRIKVSGLTSDRFYYLRDLKLDP